ncbi:MAG: Rpn family recombination-promoting nuclease/putative transposase [Prevotella sp.]|nr:Rpn family recombination-promoting nuclease/putative transposase [Prevotella sp.]
MNVKGKYLNPKADLTFKLLFGEHPDLVKSLLNALLPLEAGREIERVEYATPEMIPENPGKKNSIVDVRCHDNQGREFIVEMQLYWSDEFRQRVILNASKAVVKQAGVGEDYSLIQPVYSLNLVNEGLNLGDGVGPDEYYHHYAVVNVEHTDRVLEGFHFVFIDLKKFTPKTIVEKKMAVLWLRFLTEIDEHTQQVPEELLENPETRMALEILEKSAYSDAQLQAYSDFWMALVDERVLREGSYKKGIAEGEAKGMAKGMAKGRAEGRAEAIKENAHKMKDDGMAAALIAKYTGLSIEEIESL